LEKKPINHNAAVVQHSLLTMMGILGTGNQVAGIPTRKNMEVEARRRSDIQREGPTELRGGEDPNLDLRKSQK